MAADNGRSYILDRLKSRRTTIEDFNYDMLTAPPLSMFLSPWDIEELRKVATSVRLSSKLQEKYKMIDDICRSRGLVKFGAGTNRVVYRHPEYNNILFKIAMDDIGMGDNPAEFRNQFLLKPFCAKMFEMSPCGTVAIVERVKPIISKEEFLSVADDVFELLNTWIIGKYIVADCGAKYFMNFGVRTTFGVVVLDYPYVYEVDDRKLYCRAPDPKSPTGYCDGEIDYDDGFNILHCTKCGVKYRAKEIAKKIEEKIIVTVERSSLNMNIKVSGGSKNVNIVENVGGLLGEESKKLTGNDMVRVTPGRPNSNAKVNNNFAGNDPFKLNVQTRNNKKDKDQIKTVNGTSITSTVAEKPVEVQAPKVEEPVQVSIPTVREVPESKEEYTTPAKPAGIPAAVFGEKIESTVDKSSPVYEIEKALDIIINNIKKISINQVKVDLESRMFDKLINSDVDKESLGNLLIKLLSKAAEVDNNIISGPTMISEFIEKYYDLVAEYTNDDTKINISLRSKEAKPKDVLFLLEDAKVKNVEQSSTEETTEEKSEKTTAFDGIAWYSGKRINTREITPGLEENYDAIIVVDEDGNYLTDSSNFLIALDFVDNVSMEDYDIVSKSWLEGVIAENESYGGNPFKQKEEEETETEKEVPVGALPQTQPENDSVQQAMENFVKNEQ